MARPTPAMGDPGKDNGAESGGGVMGIVPSIGDKGGNGDGVKWGGVLLRNFTGQAEKFDGK